MYAEKIAKAHIFITIQHHNDSLAVSLTDRPYAISVVINVLSLWIKCILF